MAIKNTTGDLSRASGFDSLIKSLGLPKKQEEMLNPGISYDDFSDEEVLDTIKVQAENLLDSIIELEGINENTDSIYFTDDYLIIRDFIRLLERKLNK